MDEAGAVVWAADYKAFGEATVTTATVTNNLRFPGQYYDAETGLHYNWNRYYDPGTGRYTQVDPIGFEAGDENLYRYVMNSPEGGFDPAGLEWYNDFDDFLPVASNFSAGFGDTVSFGLTSYIRELWDIGGVDKCSGAYAAGMYTELGLEVGLTGASFALRGASKNITQAAARRGQNWHGVRGVSAVHHVNPLKKGLFPTAALPQSIRNSRMNLKLLTTSEHTAAHANLARSERYLSTAFNPATTTGRALSGLEGQCGCH